MLARGTPQLLLRKGATVAGGVIASLSLVVLAATGSPLLASIALTGVTLGNSFNQSGFLPNYLEVAGPDSGYFNTWMNTLAWAGAYLGSILMVQLRTWSKPPAQPTICLRWRGHVMTDCV